MRISVTDKNGYPKLATCPSRSTRPMPNLQRETRGVEYRAFRWRVPPVRSRLPTANAFGLRHAMKKAQRLGGGVAEDIRHGSHLFVPSWLISLFCYLGSTGRCTQTSVGRIACGTSERRRERNAMIEASRQTYDTGVICSLLAEANTSS